MVYIGLPLVILFCRYPMDLFKCSVLSHVFLSLFLIFNNVVDFTVGGGGGDLRVII